MLYSNTLQKSLPLAWSSLWKTEQTLHDLSVLSAKLDFSLSLPQRLVYYFTLWFHLHQNHWPKQELFSLYALWILHSISLHLFVINEVNLFHFTYNKATTPTDTNTKINSRVVSYYLQPYHKHQFISTFISFQQSFCYPC